MRAADLNGGYSLEYIEDFSGQHDAVVADRSLQ